MEETNKPDSNDGSGSLAGFDALSAEDFLSFDDSSQQAPPAPENKGEPKPDGKPAGTEQNDSSLENPTAPDDKPKLGESGTDGVTDDDGFKLPGDEQKSTETKTAVQWVDAAKEIGFEIKENDYKAFIEGQKSFLEKVKTETVGEIKLKSFKEEIAELPGESQLLMLGLKNGLTREQIEEPFNTIKEFKSLSDADLVAKDFELKGYPEDLVNHKIEELTESGKLELAAKELRIILDTNETKLLENKLAEVKQLEESSKRVFAEKLAGETQVIEKEINMLDKFLETPVSQKNKDYLVNKWKSGVYHELMKDPKNIVDFMVWKEFGQQGVSNLKNKITTNALEDKIRKEHNVPPAIQSGSISKQSENAKDPIGNFDAFDHLLELSN